VSRICCSLWKRAVFFLFYTDAFITNELHN
jgi:hypothetical protein